MSRMIFKKRTAWLWGIGVGILFPLFFQLGSGIYRDINPMTDSQGALARLPLPVSILACLLGLCLFARDLRRSKPALAMILGTIAVSFLSLWLGSEVTTPPLRKLTAIAQLLLPLSGLLLGQLIDDKENIVGRAFLVVISIVVPLQLLATWLQGGLILTHYLYAFSIYSHFQYVTLIFVCAFAYSLTTLWEEYKVWLCILAIPMFIYITASLSFLTIFAYSSLFLAFVTHKLWIYRANAIWVAASASLIAVAALGGATYFGKMAGQRTSVEGEQGSFYGKFKGLSEGKIPTNVQERLDDWTLFGYAIVESKKSILVGHPQPMPREIKSSPHNWYLDITYTFGLIGLFPILALIVYTASTCWRKRKSLTAQTWWLSAIVFYLVIVDSNFKVTLRQPYPGIFAYFLWGLLLSKICQAPVIPKSEVPGQA
ncbi:hypothetical protein [Polaromonas sp.]|uniref:hypothetical protein n=1 Tax=Polaromonas sp. TaxID=1869339 RepID=UPI003CADEC98